jgi:hypothetical protein
MTGGKLNETARRQQEARKKRLAEALRANMAKRKQRARNANASDQQTVSQDAVRSNDAET